MATMTTASPRASIGALLDSITTIATAVTGIAGTTANALDVLGQRVDDMSTRTSVDIKLGKTVYKRQAVLDCSLQHMEIDNAITDFCATNKHMATAFTDRITELTKLVD